MVHTLEIVQEISMVQLCALTEGFSFPQQQVRSLLFSSEPRVSFHVSLGRRYPGVNSLWLRRVRYNGTNYYYALMRLEPQALIQRQRTINLFHATNDNVDVLRDSFHELMNHFIDDRFSNLVTLEDWSCQRIDYSHNLYFDSPEEIDLFLYLSRHTSRHVRRVVKSIGELPDSEQSTAEGNRSTKATFYGKRRQVEDTYIHIPQRDYERLHAAACNIVRFEYQCKRNKVQSLKRRQGFDTRSIINYLDEGLSRELLLKVYDESIGRGDFYKRDELRRRIQDANLKPRMKDKLCQFVELVSNARPRSMSKAKEIFMNGTAGSHGSAITFANYCKRLAEIGVHPLSIPRDMALDYLQNPVEQLEYPQ